MKPKENIIDKMDSLMMLIETKEEVTEEEKALARKLCEKCHTMNIHKAKVVYFKRMKLALETLAHKNFKYNLDTIARERLCQEMRSLYLK